MLNFVVFHLFPVLNVLANDIWVTSGELGKSWDSVLAVLPRLGLLPWTLMSDSRNEMLPLRAETITTDWINIHLSLLFRCCFIEDYVGWVVSDCHWYDIIRHHVTTAQHCSVNILLGSTRCVSQWDKIHWGDFKFEKMVQTIHLTPVWLGLDFGK